MTAAKRILTAEEQLEAEQNPLWLALQRAPAGSEETEEERRMVEEALKGPRFSTEEVMASLIEHHGLCRGSRQQAVLDPETSARTCSRCSATWPAGAPMSPFGLPPDFAPL